MQIAKPITNLPEAEANDPNVLSPAEASELLAGHHWSRFMVIGDSIAKGLGDPTDGYVTATWGERIAASLASVREGVTYTNLGRRGQRAAEIRDTQLAPALELKPDLIAVLGGGNDVLAEEFDIAPVKAVLDQMVAALMESGATVVTFETLSFGRAFPDPAFEELDRRLLRLYKAIREIAQNRGAIHVDCCSPPWAGERYCFSKDLQHPTMRCQALVASATIRALSDHLHATRP